MKILVTIANFGTKNDQYLRRLLDEYASMSHEVHTVVLTNVPKSLGDGVEVVVETPQGDPWTFPFAHKKILADRLGDYDIFIYSEDDTLITERNISAFLQVTKVLAVNEIAGFIRSEKSPDGTTYFSTVHNHFHWDPESIVSRGPYTLAFFTNEHSASYILTREQLKRAIKSGGFLIGPHQEKYDLLVSAATDPYTQCNFKKLICISQIEDFVLPHLPSKYIGKLGLKDSEFFRQITALEAIHNKTRLCAALLNGEANVGQLRWSKRYYEPVRHDILDLIPDGAQRVLSYGCGWGEMEAELVRRGMRVTAIPLDSVIGACAEARGIEVVYGDLESALAKISSERFDCILATDVLHLIPKPDYLLSSLRRVLAPGGSIITSVPNLNQLPVWWHRISRHPAYSHVGNFQRTGVHLASYGMIRRWFANADLALREVIPIIPKRAERVHQILGRLGAGLLAAEFLIVGTRVERPDEPSKV